MMMAYRVWRLATENGNNICFHCSLQTERIRWNNERLEQKKFHFKLQRSKEKQKKKKKKKYIETEMVFFYFQKMKSLTFVAHIKN